MNNISIKQTISLGDTAKYIAYSLFQAFNPLVWPMSMKLAATSYILENFIHAGEASPTGDKDVIIKYLMKNLDEFNKLTRPVMFFNVTERPEKYNDFMQNIFTSLTILNKLFNGWLIGLFPPGAEDLPRIHKNFTNYQNNLKLEFFPSELISSRHHAENGNYIVVWKNITEIQCDEIYAAILQSCKLIKHIDTQWGMKFTNKTWYPGLREYVGMPNTKSACSKLFNDVFVDEDMMSIIG